MKNEEVTDVLALYLFILGTKVENYIVAYDSNCIKHKAQFIKHKNSLSFCLIFEYRVLCLIP